MEHKSKTAAMKDNLAEDFILDMVGKEPDDNNKIYTSIASTQQNGMKQQRLIQLHNLVDLVAIPLHLMPRIEDICLEAYCEDEWIPHYIAYIWYRYYEELTYLLKDEETRVYDTVTLKAMTEEDAVEYFDHKIAKLDIKEQAMKNKKILSYFQPKVP